MEKGREVISPGHPEDFVLPDLEPPLRKWMKTPA